MNTRYSAKFYTVWRRADGYVSASAGDTPTTDMPGFHIIGNYPEWKEALHVILTERGIVNPEEHRENNCTKCWEEE